MVAELPSRGRVWVRHEAVVLPTYPPLAADPNPMFLERRVNQGTSGRVYPTPLTDRLSVHPEDRRYEAIFLENEYLELMLLPELGGRVHAARDKTNGYDFVYRQHVIKPAFIGLFGPWISGGMEFNWPLHHRPSTFMPVAHAVEESADGSRTVWLGEHEPIDRTKGMVGVCLHPGQALIELKVRLYNRTCLPQTFLWWVNMAVHTHDQYQVVFPPDVWAVTDHSKRAMSHYPIARGSYYGVDLSQGVDLSWHRNTPVPASFFAYETRYDFFGGYDHRADAGLIHVANRHISPGKKFFTWGTTGPAQAWERNLTDHDGPYLELMAGVYTDNQPDFSWLHPFETKTFSQFVYPVHGMGPPHNADTRVAVHLELGPDEAVVGACATEPLPGSVLVLAAGEQILWRYQIDLAPGAPHRARASLPPGVDRSAVRFLVRDRDGRELIAYQPEPRPDRPLPEPKRPPPQPALVPSADRLYLTGVHVEQYRHPTIDPAPYWEEALRRDPQDARSHRALGLFLLRQGRLAEAEDHLRRAIEALTLLNPNPQDGEVWYDLGLVLRYLGRLDESFAAFYKAIWSYAWQSAGYYALAEVCCRRGQLDQALEHLDRSLQTNALHLKARTLKAAVLRRLGRLAEAQAEAQEVADQDPLDAWSRHELTLLASQSGMTEPQVSERLAATEARLSVGGELGQVQMHLDLAFDYAGAGLWEEAAVLLTRLRDRADSAPHPIVLYALGYVHHQRGDDVEAARWYRSAAALSPDNCFPARLEEMLALEHALATQPDDARAHYYLGNLLFDKQRVDEAIAAWERAVALEPTFAIPWRNLGIACYNTRHDGQRARECYERACAANPDDGRLLCELDQLQRRLGEPAANRLWRLEARPHLIEQRDDLCLSQATLYNILGQPDRALALLGSRRFIPWEGGEGRVSDQYVEAHVQLGRTALASGDPEAALEHFEAAGDFPDSLGEGRSPLQPLTDLDYLLGLAHQAAGHAPQAQACFQRAARSTGGLSVLTYYQALALRQLGQSDQATELLTRLLDQGRQQRDQPPSTGFLTSLPRFVFEAEDPTLRQRIVGTFLVGLAHLGLGDQSAARRAFLEVLALDPGHLAVLQEVRLLEALAASEPPTGLVEGGAQ